MGRKGQKLRQNTVHSEEEIRQFVGGMEVTSAFSKLLSSSTELCDMCCQEISVRCSLRTARHAFVVGYEVFRKFDFQQ